MVTRCRILATSSVTIVLSSDEDEKEISDKLEIEETRKVKNNLFFIC